MYPYNLRPRYKNNTEKNSNFSANPLNIRNVSIKKQGTDDIYKQNKNIDKDVINKKNLQEDYENNEQNIEENTEPINENKEECPTPNMPSDNRYILEMIKEAINDEMTDAKYYSMLLECIDDEKDINAINKIYMDEVKHSKILNAIYFMLTGEYPNIIGEQPKLSDELNENLSDRLYEELEAVEFYRKLMFAFLNLEIRDMLFEIITDEQSHAQIINYLFAKYN